MFLLKILKSFGYALSGVWDSIKTERNFRIHIVAAIVTYFFAYECNFSKEEYVLLTLIIFAVMSFELINTSLEALADAVTTEKNPLIKKAKDASAAAVLLTAFGAIVSAYFLYARDGRIIDAVIGMQESPIKAWTAVIVAVLCVIFVAGRKERD